MPSRPLPRHASSSQLTLAVLSLTAAAGNQEDEQGEGEGEDDGEDGDGDGEADDPDLDEDQLAELEEAMQSLGTKSLSLQLEEHQLRRSLKYAILNGIRGNKPGPQELARGADPRGAWDYQALARAILDDHATLNTTMRDKVLPPLMDEVFRLRTRLAYLEGRNVGLLAHETFEAPSRSQTRAANKHSRRTLEKINAHLWAIWELTDGDEDSLEGFENLIVALIERGLPCSGTRWAQRWVTKGVVAKLHAQPRLRRALEVERTRHKIWAPSAFNTKEREGHVGARQWRATRGFMCRQRPGTTVLLASKREGVNLAKLWTPLSSIAEGPLAAEDKEVDEAAIARAAAARAEKMMERSTREQAALHYKATKDWEEKAKRAGAAAPMEEEEEEQAPALNEFEAAGVELLVSHMKAVQTAAEKRAEKAEEQAAETRKQAKRAAAGAARAAATMAARADASMAAAARDAATAATAAPAVRKQAAKKAWTLGGEVGTVFEDVNIHHLVIVDSDRKLLGFSKVLVSEHEAFIDELHVARRAQGKRLAYHLMAELRRLELPDTLQVRLQVEIDNVPAVRTYNGVGMHVWGQADESGTWQPPIGVWGDNDGPEAFNHMLAAAARDVIDGAEGKSAGTRLPAGASVLHFIDGEAVAPAAEVDWTAKFNAARRDEKEARGPRDEKERLALSCGTVNLVDPLARQLIGRSLHNVLTPCSNAVRPGFQLSADGSGHMKNVDRRFNKVTLVMLILKCWGIKGDGEDWGIAHVRHGMPNSQSPDYAFVLRAWLGDDHAANLTRGLVPYIEMMTSLRRTAFRIPHMWLGLPPILYAADGRVLKRLKKGTAEKYTSRFACISRPEMHARGMLSMDLSAENELTAQHYGGDGEKNQSSWANEDTHNDQSRICMIKELGKARTLKQECQMVWPKAWRAMLAIVLMMNDPSIDWSHATREPLAVERKGTGAPDPEAGTNAFPLARGRGRKEKSPPDRSGGGNAKKPKGTSIEDPRKMNCEELRTALGKLGLDTAGLKAQLIERLTQAMGGNSAAPQPAPRPVETDAVRKDGRLPDGWEYVLPEVRRRAALPKTDADAFTFESWVSDVDGSIDGAENDAGNPPRLTVPRCRATGVRLVRWPCISAFGSRSLPDILGGDESIATKFMGMCVLHADMRIPEDVVEHLEERLRSRLNSGSSINLDSFNETMSSGIKLRHSIKKSADTHECFPVSFDGTDSKNLRGDWEGLVGLTEEGYDACARTGQWPSRYFTALHAALVAAGDCEDVIAELPNYARCVVHYALAMREARKMPSDLRPDPESAYCIFESESRRFVTEYVALGWSMKAYGFHLWANLPHLMRKWGSLEGVSQQCVEGMIGKVARIMPHLQLKPVGPYSKEIRGCREKELAELERRRAHMDAPAEAIVEELMMDTLATKYGLTPKDHDAMPLSEVLLKIDEAIAAKNVIPYDLYVAYWRRYMWFTAIECSKRARLQLRHGTTKASLTRVLDEVNAYYDPARHQHTVSSAHTNEEMHKIMMKARKAVWRAASKGTRTQGGGPFVGGGELAYQQTAGAARALFEARAEAFLEAAR